jgi:DNA-binding transcriptional ArsR family regulator
MNTVALDDRAYKALGHDRRRVILSVIGTGEATVGAIGERVELSQPIVSQHLRVLREAGLVTVRADGNRRLYSVDFARIAALRSFLDQFWTTKLGELKVVAESAPSEGEPR